MTELKEKTDLTSQKKKHWKSLKEEFTKKWDDFNIEIDWGYKDTKYYHPMVIITDNVYVHYQCDLDSGRAYAEQINFKGVSHDNCIYFDDIFTKEYLIENITLLEEKLELLAKKTKDINDAIKSLEYLKKSMFENVVPAYIGKIEKRKAVRLLEDTTEFIQSLKVV